MRNPLRFFFPELRFSPFELERTGSENILSWGAESRLSVSQSDAGALLGSIESPEPFLFFLKAAWKQITGR
jgi:hypothetical protein